MTRALIVVEPGLDPSVSVGLVRDVVQDVTVLTVAAPGVALEVEEGGDLLLGATIEGFESAETVADVIADVARRQDASLVVLATTSRFREVFPLLAKRLDASCVADVTALRNDEGALHAERLVYGGVAVASVLLAKPVAVVTAPAPKSTASLVAAQPVDVSAVPTASKRLVSRDTVEREAKLPTAKKIVSFGRGLRSQDDTALIQRLAELLTAEVGCSRPIVEDMRWLTVDHQVGLTGTTVTPELYVAVGISGQIQHLVGMRDSKVIVAINNNPAAPIFTVADIGIVGDLYEIVPRLIDALAAKA